MVLRDAALALHHMHRRGIAHMDVKVLRVSYVYSSVSYVYSMMARACVVCTDTPQRTPDPSPIQQHKPPQPSNLLRAGDGSWRLGDLGHALKTDGSMPLVEEGDARYLDRCVFLCVFFRYIYSMYTYYIYICTYVDGAHVLWLCTYVARTSTHLFALSLITTPQPNQPKHHRSPTPPSSHHDTPTTEPTKTPRNRSPNTARSSPARGAAR